MKKLWKGATALMLLGLACTPLVSACVQAEAMFFVREVKAQGCEAVGVDGANLARGTMDVRFSCSYLALLELGNQLVPRGDQAKLQVETSRINVTDVDVELLSLDGSTLTAFNYPTTGFINPSSGTAPGRGVAGALLVDQAGAAAAYGIIGRGGKGDFKARIVVYGRTLGGDDIETRPFDFPIQICDGCLCTEPANDTCVDAQSAPSEQCFLPQDATFDCRWLGGVSCADVTSSCGG